jgi:hypothetical protein
VDLSGYLLVRADCLYYVRECRIVRISLYGPGGYQLIVAAHENFPEEVRTHDINMRFHRCANLDQASRRLKWALLRHAILGKEPFRFGAMIGELECRP